MEYGEGAGAAISAVVIFKIVVIIHDIPIARRQNEICKWFELKSASSTPVALL